MRQSLLKLLLLLLAVVAWFIPATGQTIEYGFVSSMGTFTPITGGLSLGTETTDDQRFVDPAIPAGGTVTTGPGLPIGFDFMFNSVTFDRLAINANGWISFGQSTLTPSVNNASTSGYTPLQTTAAITPDILINRVSGLGRDLQAQAGATLRLETFGTAPNRICVIQWQNYKKYGTTGAGDVFNFQIRLFETTNKVEIVYGQMTSNATSGNFQVGLRGPLVTDFNSRQTASDWTNTTASTANTQFCVMSNVIYPPAGLTFTFTYPVANQPPNPANIVSPANGAANVTPYISLNWTSGGGLPNGYRVFFGTDNPPSNIVSDLDVQAAVTYLPANPLSPTTQYYWQIIPYNAHGSAVNCPVWSFTTHGDPTITQLPYNQNFDDVTVPNLPFDWSRILQASVTTAYLETNTTTPHTAPNCIRMANGSDANAIVILIAPPLAQAIPVNTARLKFYARGVTANYPLSIGVMTDPTNAATYQEIQVILPTTTWAEYIIPMQSYTGAGRFIAVKHGLGGTSRTFYLDTFTIEPVGANDLGAVSVTGNVTPAVDTPSNYTISVLNWGTAAQNTYQVQLIDANNTVLASVPGVPVNPGQTMPVVVSWTPTAQGQVLIRGKVVLVGDINPDNDTSPVLTVSVQPAGQNVFTIGSGTAVNTTTGAPTPYGTFYKNFRQQYLYTATELYAAGAAPGMITAIAYNVQVLNTIVEMPNYRIRIKHTNQAVLTTTFEAGDYTQVWQHANFLPQVGLNVHTFTQPFIWDGVSNVIVDILTSLIPGAYTQNAGVYYTPTTGVNTCLRYQSDSVSADTATTGTLSVNRANTSFFMHIGGMGTLTGTVTSGGNPLSGALVVVNTTIWQQTTGANGQYYFQFIQPGTYTVTVSKLGYETQTLPVTIVAEQTTTQNFALVASQTVNVTGTVVGSDNPTAGLSDATINLTGAMNYSGTTNAQGQFTVTGVLSGNTYNYAISRAGYQNGTGTITVGSTNYSMGTITLNELTLPPVQVQAALNQTETAINITWRAPGATGGANLADFETDNGGWVPSSNWTNPLGDWQWTNTWDVANFVPNEYPTSNIPPPNAFSGTGMWGTRLYQSYSNSGGFSYLTRTFDLSGSTNSVIRFRSWNNTNGSFDYARISVNGNIVWGPQWDGTAPAWNERIVQLTAYDGMSNVTIVFEFYATTVVAYAGWYIDDVYVGAADAYPSAVASSTNQEKINPNAHSYRTVSVQELAEQRDLEIKALNNNSRFIHFANQGNNIQVPEPIDRIPVGYRVWRLQQGQEQNEASWTLLTANTVTDTFFVDNGWLAIPDGEYKWAVKTVYTNNVLSNPALSNMVRKRPHDMAALSITGNITPSAGMSTTYTITIKNNGSVSQAAGAYSVKLMSGTTELVSVPGPAIAPNITVQVPVSWIPPAQGAMTIFGRVSHPLDSFTDNNDTAAMNIFVMPAGQTVVTIGDGTATNTTTGAPTPYGTYYKAFRQQYLYTAADITAAGGGFGFISGIGYNAQALNTCVSMPNYTIRIKPTTQTVLTTTFEVGDYITVWTHPNYLPEVGWNTHPFNQPYLWDGVSNLLVEIVTDMILGNYTQNVSVYYTPTTGVNTCLRFQSDSANGSTGTTGTLSVNRANTRLYMILGGVGHIQGTVTGVGGTPLSGVTVTFDPVGYQAITNAQGHYAVQNILVDDYNVTYSVYGYVTQTIPVQIQEDVTTTQDVTMQPMASVNVTGTIHASDTGGPLSEATIALSGYASYNGTSNAAGQFTIPNVYANQTYAYVIQRNGYQNALGSISVGSTNHNMGTIVLPEIAYPPLAVQAAINGGNNAVNITWLAPDPNALEIIESFESVTFPPQDWTRTVTNTGPAHTTGVYPTWCRFGQISISGQPVSPTDGSFQAGLWWDYNHQDEWLITPAFNCPPSAILRFDTYAYYGSTNADHYYVKVTTDNGANWTVLWDASTQTGGWNYYGIPVTIDLNAYSGNQVKLAWHAVDGPSNDGLWYVWFIDNVYIGNLVLPVTFAPEEIAVRSAGNGFSVTRAGMLRQRIERDEPVMAYTNISASRAVEQGLVHQEPIRCLERDPDPADRALLGYKVWRMQAGQEQNEAAWILLTPTMITTLSHSDNFWQSLPNGSYRWAVKAVYTSNVLSLPALSNVLLKDTVTGNIAGVVRRNNNQPIMGATVTAGTISATTNTMGVYSMVVPIGTYNVTASAAGYGSVTQQNIVVNANQTTTVNFILSVPAEDEVTPVTTTTLQGNYPNPFNPETTIRFDLKDASFVTLEIYNLKGQVVRTLISREMPSGRHSIVWNAIDDNNRQVSSGIYFYRMKAGSYVSTRKMVLME